MISTPRKSRPTRRTGARASSRWPTSQASARRICPRAASISPGRRFRVRTSPSPEASADLVANVTRSRPAPAPSGLSGDSCARSTQDGRAPRAIVLENVYGCLTSRAGRDFAAIAAALAGCDYRFGAAVIDAAHFVPQSRPRVFFVAVRDDEAVPDSLIADGPQQTLASRSAHQGSRRPRARGETKLDLVEDPRTAGAKRDLRGPHRRRRRPA